MSLFINQNNGPVYNDCTVTIINGQTKVETVKQPEPQTEEVQPEPVESFIFTSKAKQEGEIAAIIQALRESVDRRRDKTRAFVKKLQEWQNAGYIDTHYNARVMYDELDKLMPLSFGYEVFKKHYNNTRV